MRSVLSRRRFLLTAGMIGGSAIIASCAPTPAPAAPEEGPAKEEATAAPAAQQATVQYWSYRTRFEETEPPLLEKFMDANPDIKVEWQYVPWQQYWEKLNATLAAGNPPDVWNTAPTYFFEYILRNQLTDLTEMLKRDVDMDDFHVQALNGYDLLGKYYGAPINIVTAMCFFNKSLFDEAGVEPPPLDGDWTWDDYLEKCQALTTALNPGEKIMTWGGNAFQSSWWLDEVIMSNGGTPLKGEFRRDLVGMEGNYDDPICCETFSFQNDLINTYKVSPPAGEFEGQGDPLLTGRLGMTWALPFGVLTYADAPFEWDLTQIPVGSQERVTYGGADGLVISQASQVKEESWRLILYQMDPEGGGALLLESGAIPVFKSSTEAYLALSPDKNLQACINAADVARNTFTLGFNEWKQAETDELQRIFLGEVPADEGCVNVDRAVDETIEKIRKEFQEAIGG